MLDLSGIVVSVYAAGYVESGPNNDHLFHKSLEYNNNSALFSLIHPVWTTKVALISWWSTDGWEGKLPP